MEIIIIGAGISGVILAYLLQKYNIPCKILERDIDVNARNQGFSLTMQGRTKEILEEIGLLNEFYKYGEDVNIQIFYNNNGEILYKNDKNNEDRFNYPLPRQKIREIIISLLKENTILWGKKIINISNNMNNKKNIICSDGSEYTCDLLIGCDGINSIVRKLCVTDENILNDLDLMNIYGIVNINNLSDDDKKIFKNHEVQVLSGHYRLFSKPYDKDHQMWEFTYPLNNKLEYDEILKNSNNIDPKKIALDKIINIVQEWKPTSIINFLKKSINNTIIIHPLYDFIPDNSFISKIPDNVVLLGDSIHPMAPYIGRGANEAIEDAYDLAIILKKYNGILNREIINEFYDKMLPRVQASVIRSRQNTQFYHTNKVHNLNELYEFKNWKK